MSEGAGVEVRRQLGGAEAVDGLLRITDQDDGDRVGTVEEGGAEDVPLDVVGVLELVDEHHPESPAQSLDDGRAVGTGEHVPGIGEQTIERAPSGPVPAEPGLGGEVVDQFRERSGLRGAGELLGPGFRRQRALVHRVHDGIGQGESDLDGPGEPGGRGEGWGPVAVMREVVIVDELLDGGAVVGDRRHGVGPGGGDQPGAETVDRRDGGGVEVGHGGLEVGPPAQPSVGRALGEVDEDRVVGLGGIVGEVGGGLGQPGAHPPPKL